MAVEPEFLARGDSRRKPAGRVAAAVLLIVAAALALTRFSTHSSATLTARSVDGAGQPHQRTVAVTGSRALRLLRDLQALTPGRIPCGAPGPVDVVLAFRDASYDVNGECARVVRLPERPGETVWLESAALHDHLAALIGP
ncbi:MAG: hypothetical protein QOE24_1400 [Frankiales bacterium]|nr:hypothetical protein [Frankiales bacterium]